MMQAYLLVFVALLAAHSAAEAQECVPAAGRVSTVDCFITRKNSWNGFSKVVKGRFSYDAAAAAASYEYAAPFSFRFILSDTAVVGIDLRRNAGYRASRAGEMPRCGDLYAAVHLFDAYLRCVNTNMADLTPTGCTKTHWYYERKNSLGTDMVARNIQTGAVDCIESFDGKGVMYQQLKARFDEGRGEYCFPVRVVIRRDFCGILTSDTVLVSRAAVNKVARRDAFALPPGCKLDPMDEMRQGLFSTERR
jgi:hypothetical protein